MAKDKSKKAYTTKKCLECHEIKDLIDFDLNKGKNDGRHPYCKTCRKEYSIIYYQQNRDKLIKKSKAHREKHLGEIKRKAREDRQKNKKKINARNKRYLQYCRDNYPAYRVLVSLRGKLWRVIKHIQTKSMPIQMMEFLTISGKSNLCNFTTYKQDKATKEFLGCDVEALKIYLEKQFSTGMSWDNYGTWHLDHIKPCCSFDLTDIEQQKICFHYTNLQPLWEIDNMKKGRKIL